MSERDAKVRTRALFTIARIQHKGLRVGLKMVQLLFVALLGFAVLIGVLLMIFQRRLIYFPRGYEQIEIGADPRVIRLEYHTIAGRQVAYYLPPRTADTAPSAPARLWVMFAGNASRALDWIEFLNRVPDERAGFLLIDYPGYGECAGAPSMAGIGAAAPGALRALAEKTNSTLAALEQNLCVMGHSLGAAAALQFAVTVPVREVLLVSPFTDLLTMARRSVGPYAFLVGDRFDNTARLAELATRSPRPRVTIVHGTADELIPVEMGRSLAERYPDWIEFVPIKGGDHNWIMESAARELYARMKP